MKQWKILDIIRTYGWSNFTANLLSTLAIYIAWRAFLESEVARNEIRVRQLDLDSLSYLVSAHENHPRLKVSKEFEIVGMDVQNYIAPDSLDSQNDTVRISTYFIISGGLQVVNIGNSLAKLLMTASYDSLTYSPVMRESVQKLDDRLKKALFIRTYRLEEILPGDTAYLKFSRPIYYVRDHRFTLHIFLLYSNEIGNLFDTYYWATYDIKDMLVETITDQKGGRRFMPGKMHDPKEIVQMGEHPVKSYNTYSKSQTHLFMNYLNVLKDSYERNDK